MHSTVWLSAMLSSLMIFGLMTVPSSLDGKAFPTTSPGQAGDRFDFLREGTESPDETCLCACLSAVDMMSSKIPVKVPVRLVIKVRRFFCDCRLRLPFFDSRNANAGAKRSQGSGGPWLVARGGSEGIFHFSGSGLASPGSDLGSKSERDSKLRRQIINSLLLCMSPFRV